MAAAISNGPQNKCNDYKREINDIFQRMDSQQVFNPDQNFYNEIILLMAKLFRKGDLTKRVQHFPDMVGKDNALYEKLKQSIQTNGINNEQTILLSKTLKQLLMVQINTAYIILCKVIIKHFNKKDNKNECIKFKNQLNAVVNNLIINPMTTNKIYDVMMLIDDLFLFAQTNNLINDVDNPIDLDHMLYIESKDDEQYILLFRELLIEQVYTLYIIICKPEEFFVLIEEKDQKLKEAKRDINDNNIPKDLLYKEILKGGSNIKKLSKLFYKVYKNLYLLSKCLKN
jgi:hypothetical protein